MKKGILVVLVLALVFAGNAFRSDSGTTSHTHDAKTSQKLLDCYACNGTGIFKYTGKTCTSCGGSGKTVLEIKGDDEPGVNDWPFGPVFTTSGTRCPICNGTGTKSCSSCHGTGDLVISKYNPSFGAGGGIGMYETTHRCHACGGDGLVPCTNCGGDGRL